MEAFNKLMQNKHAAFLLEAASKINKEFELPTGLGLTDEKEISYTNLLSGKEIIVDQQARRRGTDVPGYEVSDELLKVSGLLRGRDKKGEEAFLQFVNSVQEDLSQLVGPNREKMIRFAVHDLFSRALHEGRKEEKSLSNLRRNNLTMHLDPIDMTKRKAYWKEQIANPPDSE